MEQERFFAKTQAKQFLVYTFPFFRFFLGICPFRYVKVNHHLVLVIVIRLSFAFADSNKSSVIILDIMLGHIKQLYINQSPFQQRPFCSVYFELCNLMRVGRKQHNYLVHNFEMIPIPFSKMLSSMIRYIGLKIFKVFKTKVTMGC